MTDDNKAIALEKLHKLSSVLKTPSVERKLRDAAAKATEAVESDAKRFCCDSGRGVDEVLSRQRSEGQRVELVS